MNTNRTVGTVLLVIGVLVAGLSGLCTGAFLFDQASSGVSTLDAENGVWILILLFGGLPFLFGAMLILGGILALRNARRQARSDNDGGPPR